jgi:hypothetical protein
VRTTLILSAIVFTVFFQACTSQPAPTSQPSPPTLPPDTEHPPTTIPSQADIVGTWRWISVTDGSTGKIYPIPADNPILIRFFPDGKCASWPVPKDEITTPGDWNTDSRRVSRRVYKIDHGELTLPDATDADKCEVRATADKLWYWTSDHQTCLWYRITPDLNPGQLP